VADDGKEGKGGKGKGDDRDDERGGHRGDGGAVDGGSAPPLTTTL
jgi:hypothetical protein